VTRMKEDSIRKLKNKEVPQFQAYLRSLGFPRNRLGSREDSLLDFFVLHAPVVSGRSKRYWCGSEETFYHCYVKHCGKMGISPPEIATVKLRDSTTRL